MLQRKPDITAASMTNMKPQNSNAVSFATVNKIPTDIIKIMPKSLTLGVSNLNAKANIKRNIGDADLHMVAKVTEMKTRDALLKLISSAVASDVGTTVKGKVHLSQSSPFAT